MFRAMKTIKTDVKSEHQCEFRTGLHNTTTLVTTTPGLRYNTPRKTI